MHSRAVVAALRRAPQRPRKQAREASPLGPPKPLHREHQRPRPALGRIGRQLPRQPRLASARRTAHGHHHRPLPCGAAEAQGRNPLRGGLHLLHGCAIRERAFFLLSVGREKGRCAHRLRAGLSVVLGNEHRRGVDPIGAAPTAVWARLARPRAHHLRCRTPTPPVPPPPTHQRRSPPLQPRPHAPGAHGCRAPAPPCARACARPWPRAAVAPAPSPGAAEPGHAPPAPVPLPPSRPALAPPPRAAPASAASPPRVHAPPLPASPPPPASSQPVAAVPRPPWRAPPRALPALPPRRSRAAVPRAAPAQRRRSLPCQSSRQRAAACAARSPPSSCVAAWMSSPRHALGRPPLPPLPLPRALQTKR
jgi:hypothetical protein